MGTGGALGSSSSSSSSFFVLPPAVISASAGGHLSVGRGGASDSLMGRPIHLLPFSSSAALAASALAISTNAEPLLVKECATHARDHVSDKAYEAWQHSPIRVGWRRYVLEATSLFIRQPHDVGGVALQEANQLVRCDFERQVPREQS